MMRLSYQNKRRLKKWGIVLGVLLLCLTAIWACWMIWLQRFLVFTRDGVKVSFDRSTLELEEKPHGSGSQRETVGVDIVINDGENAVPPVSREMEKISGVYVDTTMLLDGVQSVAQELLELEPGTAIMLDVKSKFGNFYYNTSIQGASLSDSVSAEEMNQLIRDLRKGGYHLIARLPAFRDSAFAENNRDSGLVLASGALWTDEEKCYWLDPASSTVQSNLIQICRELQKMGFDEVVFTDFKIPDSGSISYSADVPKDQVIKQTAEYLVDNVASDDFVVSFQGSVEFPLPKGQCRLYMEGVAPETLDSVYASVPGEKPDVQTVFLAQTRDTRYDVCGVLRALQ